MELRFGNYFFNTLRFDGASNLCLLLQHKLLSANSISNEVQITIMNQRKRTPKDIEADVLEKSGRRCCICLALNCDFQMKSGQIAHLDGNPSNSEFDNLCFLCLAHHDDYDTKRSQSKGLTIIEVKRYRTGLYNTVASMRTSIQHADNFPTGTDTPLLDYFEESDAVYEQTTQGTQIVERQAGIRLADKDLSGKNDAPLLALSLAVIETKLEGKTKRSLRIIGGLPYGLTMQIEVCACDDWSVSGFVGVLRNKADIWMLRGNPIEGDKRDPMYHEKDFLLIYRKANGENRLIVSTHTLSKAPLQIHALFSEKVANGLANYLEKVGFTTPFNHSEYLGNKVTPAAGINSNNIHHEIDTGKIVGNEVW